MTNSKVEKASIIKQVYALFIQVRIRNASKTEKSLSNSLVTVGRINTFMIRISNMVMNQTEHSLHEDILAVKRMYHCLGLLVQ